MESNELKESIKKRIKEKIAVSNIRKEFDMKKVNKRKVFYSIISACAMFILCLGILVNMKLPTKNNELQISKDLEGKTEDKIVFNNKEIELSDIDGNWVDCDLKKEFEFLNHINISNNYNRLRQGKIYVRENVNDNYTKLGYYSLIYSIENKNNCEIEIDFSKENKIPTCLDLIEYNINLQDSIINGKKVILTKSSMDDKINGRAYFENGEYTFHIRVVGVEEEEFLNIVKSIID